MDMKWIVSHLGILHLQFTHQVNGIQKSQTMQNSIIDFSGSDYE